MLGVGCGFGGFPASALLRAHLQIAVTEKGLAAANLCVGRTVWRRVVERADGRATRMQRAMEAMAGYEVGWW